MNHIRHVVFALGAILALAASFGPQPLRTAAATSYSITELGTFGGTDSYASGINDAGQVVGTAYTANGAQHAFFWSADSGMRDLGTFGGTLHSSASDINDAGQVVGESDTDTTFGIPRAFLWSASNGMQDLGTLGGLASRARGINNAGQVVGMATTVNGAQHAFLWNASNGMQDLGTLGRSTSDALGINDTGQVVGDSAIVTSPYSRPFLWSASSGMQDLGILVGDASEARGINNAGQVVGFASIDPVNGSGITHAFVWSASSGSQDLGTLGGIASQAFRINNAGQVVGSADTASGQLHAFLWSAGVMTDLNSLLPANSGWELEQAFDINTAGQIVGYGLHNGQTRGFLLTPATSLPHRNVAVFLQGINTKLTLEDITNQSEHMAGSIVGMGFVAAPTVRGVLPPNTQYFQYSYAGSSQRTGNPIRYDCQDTFSQPISTDILLLHRQILHILGTQPVGTETDLYLFGHSLGGVVALGYLDFLQQGLLGQKPLPTSAHLKAIITLDAPIGGVADLYTAPIIVKPVYEAGGCSLKKIPLTSLLDLNKVFKSTKNTTPPKDGKITPLGARASLLVVSDARLPKTVPSNGDLAQAAQTSLGTSLLSIGNQNDFLWNLGACNVPGAPDIRATQYLEDKGGGTGLYGRFIETQPSDCSRLGGVQRLVIFNHSQVLQEPTVQTAITNFLTPIVAGNVGGTPSPLAINQYQTLPPLR